MGKILYFNPENDLALASDSARYTPPAAAADLRRSGSFLPLWLADEDDVVLIDQNSDIPLAQELCRQFGLHGKPVTRLDGQYRSFAPWGWSRSSASLFRRCGYPSELLPTDDLLDRLRMLSHRRSSIIINQMTGLSDTSMPIEAFSEEEALETIARLGHEAVIKSPWSSSGRGVIGLSSSIPDSALSFIRSVIRRQGSVMIEKKLNRVCDFAALYNVSDGQVSFEGLSVFFLSHSSAYGGNIIGDQSYLESLLVRYVSSGTLWDTINKATGALATLLAGSSYSGFAGIDMLIHRLPSGVCSVAPCIELNLRSTMGVIALYISRRLQPQMPMIMSVCPRDRHHDAGALYDVGGIPGSPFSILIAKAGVLSFV